MATGGTSYRPGAGVSGGYNSRLGRQLSGRLKSGAITRQKAGQTVYERNVLAKAFGPDWRTKVYGKGGAEGVGGPFATSIVRTKRNKALAQAKKKLGSSAALNSYKRSPFA